MNQSAQTPSQDNQDKKKLAAGEFVYEFFQPVFQTSFTYEFSTGIDNNTVAQANTPVPAVSPPAISPFTVEPAAAASAPSAAPASSVAPVTPETPIASNSNVSIVAPSVPAAHFEHPVQGDSSLYSKPDASLEKQTTDDSGAVISYGKWNILPHRIRYADRSVAEFEYDGLDRLVRVNDRDGIEWRRITIPDHQNLSTWQSSDGQTCEMSMVVIPDGTYQCISATGMIVTCTLSGRIIIWTPFSAGFDLKRTLFAIFRSVDKNHDSSLSKEEIDLASRQIWQESDSVQLISMLQTHYDAICSGRSHALCRQGSGITIEDILEFDDAAKNHQESRCSAPPHAVSVVSDIFDELNISNEGALTIHQLRIAYDKRHERDSVSKSVLQTMYEELRSEIEGPKSAFASKANNLTRSDLVNYYKRGYKRAIRGQIKIAGWGADECWQSNETSTRSLYVDPANPLESILPQAIKHTKDDPAMGAFNAIFESLVVQCPHLIVRMISQTEDGKYQVRFAGLSGNSFTCLPPSTSCLGDYLHGSKFGFWMAVIEDAYKQYEKSNTGKVDLDHLETVERICRLLNGQSGRWLNIKDIQLSDLSNSMRDIFKQRRLMIAASLSASPRVAGHRFISRSPVCGIINYDHRSGKVTVNDPVRNNVADDTSDPSNRNPDGSTTLSLSSFTTAFDKIYIEDWLSADDMLHR